jgi:hypothetical protein
MIESFAIIDHCTTESLDAFAIEASVSRYFRRMRMTLGRVLLYNAVTDGRFPRTGRSFNPG